IGITSHDGHIKVFQIPDTSSIPAQKIARSFQYLKDTLGFDIISDPEKIIPYDLGDTFNFGCVKISSVPLKAHSPGHSGFLISIPEKNSGYIDFIIHSSCLGLDRRSLDKLSFGPWFAGIKEYNIPEYFDDIGKINKIFRETALIHTNSHGLIYSKIESNNFRYFNNDKKDNSIVIFSNDTNGGHKIDEPFNYIRDIFQRRAKKVEDAIITLGYSSENIQKMMNNPKEIEYLVEKLKKFNIIFKIENFPEEMRPIYLFWERLFLINHIKYFIENYKN
ncbi:MAG: hypothetical protein GY870_19545, partial [archaeon]|nr:hypothetical protein [archaeon]